MKQSRPSRGNQICSSGQFFFFYVKAAMVEIRSERCVSLYYAHTGVDVRSKVFDEIEARPDLLSIVIIAASNAQMVVHDDKE
jgi:hypothetical protein